MRSLWKDGGAAAAVAHWTTRGASEELALRTYSARLLGADPTLVLHGGGNTSVKTIERDLFGDEVRVLRIKGSGWDLARIEPPGHPAVRLEPLLRLRSLDRLSDEDMVGFQRANLLDSAAPNPSVEALLHAFIPETFIDHTHSTAVLALADQPDAAELIARLYGERVAVVPYVMPGFDLARAAADAYDAHPGIEGLILLKHGVFSFGVDRARELRADDFAGERGGGSHRLAAPAAAVADRRRPGRVGDLADPARPARRRGRTVDPDAPVRRGGARDGGPP